MKRGFASAVRLAKVKINTTPQTLRHTAATWLMQEGADEWVAAGYLGMSVEVLRSTYGHHHPDFMKGAMDAITSKKKPSQKEAQSLPQSVPRPKLAKSEWGVSVGAMIKRLANLGELSPHNERRLWQYYSARRWRTRKPLDDQIPIERPENLKTSIEMLVTEDGISPQVPLREIGLSASDVIMLCGLSEGSFDDKRPNPTRVRPALKVVSKENDPDEDPSSKIIPLRLGDR